MGWTLKGSRFGKVETIHVTINGCIDQQDVVYTYNGMLLSFKEEGNLDTRSNMDDIMLSNINQTQKDKYCSFPLIVVTFIETEGFPGAGS